MKKISIDEADKILAAHRPKETQCPSCGFNLVNHIPRSKVEAKIKELEMEIWKQKENHESDAWIKYGELHAQFRVLKELLNDTKVE